MGVVFDLNVAKLTASLPSHQPEIKIKNQANNHSGTIERKPSPSSSAFSPCSEVDSDVTSTERELGSEKFSLRDLWVVQSGKHLPSGLG